VGTASRSISMSTRSRVEPFDETANGTENVDHEVDVAVALGSPSIELAMLPPTK
jgi:hypothetical protein